MVVVRGKGENYVTHIHEPVMYTCAVPGTFRSNSARGRLSNSARGRLSNSVRGRLSNSARGRLWLMMVANCSLSVYSWRHRLKKYGHITWENRVYKRGRHEGIQIKSRTELSTFISLKHGADSIATVATTSRIFRRSWGTGSSDARRAW